MDENVTFPLPNAVAVPNHPKFNRSLPTTLYAHGLDAASLIWTYEDVRIVTEAYTLRGGCNFLLLDYASVANKNRLLQEIFRDMISVSLQLVNLSFEN